MRNKTTKLVTSNISVTDLPKFDNSDIGEIDNFKSQLIEQSYNSNLNAFQKASFHRAIEIVDNRILDASAYYLIKNAELHKDSYDIKWKGIHNQDSIGLKIEEWNDLEIRIGLDKATFIKISSKSTRVRLLSTLNWDNKNIKIDCLRILTKGELRKSDFIVLNKENAKVNPYETPVSQSIKNELSSLRNDIYNLFPELSGVDPIPYNRSNHFWSTPIKIVLLDGEEKRVETEIKQLIKLGHKREIAETYAPKFHDPGADTFDENQSWIKDQYSENLPVDDQENDNGY
jgi:hypothetical protein